MSVAERKERRGGSEGKRGRRMEKDGTEISHLFFRLGKECLMVKNTIRNVFLHINTFLTKKYMQRKQLHIL